MNNEPFDLEKLDNFELDQNELDFILINLFDLAKDTININNMYLYNLVILIFFKKI
jgi:hypothetical protein